MHPACIHEHGQRAYERSGREELEKKMPRKHSPEYAAENIAVGPVSLPVAHVTASFPADLRMVGDDMNVARNGVIIVNEVVKASVRVGDTLVPVMISLRVVRGPIGATEEEACTRVKDTRDAQKKAKTEAEQTKREREIATAQQKVLDARKGLVDPADFANYGKIVKSAVEVTAALRGALGDTHQQ